MDFKYCKLEIFIPETHISQLQKALQSVDAGHIGNYDSCMSCSQLTSYWRPLGGTSPYIGNVGEISCEPEVKVEVTVFTEKVEKLQETDGLSFSRCGILETSISHQSELPVHNKMHKYASQNMLKILLERRTYVLYNRDINERRGICHERTHPYCN